MAVEAEVPVLVAQLEADAVEEVGVGALVGHVTVALVDLAVLVAIHQCVLDRLAVLVVNLLEAVVGVGCITHHVALEQVARTLGDAAHLDGVVGVVGVVELGELGVLERAVEADREVPVLGLHGDEIQVELHALVLHRADVGEHRVAEVRAHGGDDVVQEVVRLTQVPVDAAVDAPAEEPEVEADVVGRRGLPFDVGVVGARREVEHVPGAAHVIGLIDVGRHVVTRQVGIIGADLLLPGLPHADAQLEGRDGTRILQEILLGDVPRKGARREEAPAGILRETR